MITDEFHGKAKIIDVTPGRITEALGKKHIVIVAGFQGVSQSTNEITTLGRGGSDTTAVALAAADTYVVVLALTDVMSGVGLGLDNLQRAAPIISGFLLGYIAVLPLVGRLADLVSRQKVLLAPPIAVWLMPFSRISRVAGGLPMIGSTVSGSFSRLRWAESLRSSNQVGSIVWRRPSITCCLLAPAGRSREMTPEKMTSIAWPSTRGA